MKLSENFYLNEFTKSQIAERHGLDNTPTNEVIENLKLLCQYILQPVRDHFKRPVIISSGYRSPEVNRLAKGSPTSQHVIGMAADFEINGLSNLALAEWIRDNLVFDQLILEFWVPEDPNSGWVHCSYNQAKNRKQTLTINKYGTFSGFKTK